MPKPQQAHPARWRRGSIYIAVLGASLIVVTLGVGGLLATRAAGRSATAQNDMADARSLAGSGLELARLWISQDSNWRTTRGSGTWVSGLALGAGTISIAVSDPLDSNMTNRPHDSVTVIATGYSGRSRQMLQQTLVAKPVGLAVLGFPLHSAGDIKLKGASRLILGAATLSSSGQIKSDSGTVVEGNLVAASFDVKGDYYGTQTTSSASKPLPASTVPESYANLGTLISPGNTIDKQVLSPASNPWGTANADGVYVIRTSSNLTIRNTRILGTLVIICGAAKVTIDDSVLIQPYRSDYPSLVVNGDATLSYDSANVLSEATTGTNFNPSGTAYQGVTDLDKTDSYPNEIHGLVHVTGKVTINKPGILRGALLCAATSGDTVLIDTSTFRIVSTPSLLTTPPQFYTTSVKMASLAGSYKPLVD